MRDMHFLIHEAAAAIREGKREEAEALLSEADVVAHLKIEQEYKPKLSKGEFFAACAPEEIPEWFEIEPLPEPPYPHIWCPLKKGNDGELLRSWQKDPSYDLPSRLKHYQYEWEAYCKAQFTRKKKMEERRYFEWRIYYGQMMAQTAEKCTPLNVTGE